MIYEFNPGAVAIFATIVAFTLGLSFYLGRQAKSASGFFAAGGHIPWFVNGVAFAGDYLSAASFLGICGMIAFYGYDGFLYSIGYLAGWVVALLVVAEPLKRMGKYTFADALDSKFNSRGIKLAAAISTLAVSVFYLIPQMVGAGALVTPLFGLPHWAGVVMVGAIVILIVSTAGMVSTTWVQFIKGSLLVVFSAVLVVLILNRGLTTRPATGELTVRRVLLPALDDPEYFPKVRSEMSRAIGQPIGTFDFGLNALGPQLDRDANPFIRIEDPDEQFPRFLSYDQFDRGGGRIETVLYETQTKIVAPDGKTYIDGLPAGRGVGKGEIRPVGSVLELPDGREKTGPLGPLSFLRAIQSSRIAVWSSEKVTDSDGTVITIYYPRSASGTEMLTAGNYPAFRGLRPEKERTFAYGYHTSEPYSRQLLKKLDFLSLMLALFCGTASLPHILIRYYTVKDQAAARKSTIVGIGAIGFFYVLTLYMGLGAMTSGAMDVTNSNMAAPLLARSFGQGLFAIISAIAFTTVLGTVSGLIIAASGAVVHDLMGSVLRIEMSDRGKVRVARIASAVVGVIAILLGIKFEKLNVNYLVGWAFSVAASANLPSLVMLLFWKRTTKQGITAAILVGMTSSLAWILLSADTYKEIYGLPPETALVPFSQPGIVTIPLGFLTLVAVSLMTRPRRSP